MNNIKNEIEKKMRYFFLAIINNKESNTDEDFLIDSISDYRERWEKLSFILLDKIELQVNGFESFTYIHEGPFYDKEEENIYYTNNTEFDDFSNILIEFFNRRKTLNGDFKYILTKNIKKIKTEEKDKKYLDQIDTKWVKLDLSVKVKITEELKQIGFLDNLTFTLQYDSSDYQCTGGFSSKTQQEIQEQINEILYKYNLKKDFITINSKEINQKLIDKVRNKYLKIGYIIEDEELLLNRICLNENDIFSSMGVTKEILEKKLDDNKNKHIEKDYRLESQISKEMGHLKEKKHSSLNKTTNVKNTIEKDRNFESRREAKKRGLKIEKLKVKGLAKIFENEKVRIREKASEIFDLMKIEKLPGNDIKRFNLKSEEYKEILEEGSLQDILHVSKSLGDGLGFDIFYPVKDNNGEMTLLKVEVKSSLLGETIYLSENERKQILLYKTSNDPSFRVYLYKKNTDPTDITGIVYEILETNNSFLNIHAETWILDVKCDPK